MKVYRSIVLNNNDNINTDSIGVAWTLCEVFAEDHARSMMSANDKDGYVILEANIDVNSIDWSNTLWAMETRSNEYEVVLDGGSIEANIRIVEGLDHLKEGEMIHGRVGWNIFEDYNDRYEGEITKEMFLDLASEF